ncbi:DNA replication protein DnaC [Alkalihalobacillus xiaoxiensis]|uniref:DNA replication protein DnaC n=1 Tax=Shouchella xiaoxiensis TaxID=766895 RepID=A0ABS2SPZ3_9BACI|nr:ATP-binding protein [Shouchella xiaoxiensis]MBM7837071.1 DNA replication protein DnaC [Shouchella xiaoxiensis]
MKELRDLFEKNIHRQISDENEVRRFLCEGCEQEVIVYKMMLFFGTEKGKMKEMNRGCKCEDLRLGREARQAQIKMKQKHQMKWFEQFSLVNVDLLDARFDNYQPTTDKQEEAHSICQSYVDEFTKTSGNLILSGPVTGIGKSHLSYSIVKALSSKGYKTLFLSVPKLLAAIRATYKPNSEQSEYDIIQRLVEVDCLCMDDLGAEYSKKDADGWVASKLFEIVDARLGKPTIYTTNLSADELVDRVGRRNFSRILYKTTSIKMDGQDYREWVKALDRFST